MPRFEYKVIEVQVVKGTHAALERELAEAGRNGWEIINVCPIPDPEMRESAVTAKVFLKKLVA